MTSRGAASGPPQPTRMNLALFDLDHTLLPIDSDYAWGVFTQDIGCLLYTSPSPRDRTRSRMPSSA